MSVAKPGMPSLGEVFTAIKSAVSNSVIGKESAEIRAFGKQVASKAHYTDAAGKVNTMNRVKDGLTVALAGLALLPRVATEGVKFVGQQINTLAKKKPVLAMSLGLVGTILGGVLCSVQPFAGVALTAASVYAMARGLKEASSQGLLAAKKAALVKSQDDQPTDSNSDVGLSNNEEASKSSDVESQTSLEQEESGEKNKGV